MAKAPITLATPVQYAKGVGDVRALELGKLGIVTCGHLLFYLPRDWLRYADEGGIPEMRVGEVATVRGTVLQTRMIKFGKRRFEVLLDDSAGGAVEGATPQAGADGSAGAGESGRCVLTWFNAWGMDKNILPGMTLRVTGKVTLFRNRRQMVNPKHEILTEDADPALKQARIEPVYPATAELTSAVIGKLVMAVMEELLPQVAEWFPEAFLAERNLFSRREALRKIHVPLNLQDTIKAKRTLAYHEFFLHQLAVAIKRYHQRNATPAASLRVDEAVDRRIRALLPFELTGAQNRVIESIRKDLSAVKPMNRLLQGDVGSGKTVVALYAMLAAAATVRGDAETLNEERGTLKEDSGVQGSGLKTRDFRGHQAALMAPTEILAEQHYITLMRLLEGKKVKIGLLTGSVTGKERMAILAGLAEGSLALVVGTHALLTEEVRFKSLAVAVIDEQHKFGVEHRSMLRSKQGVGGGLAPHTLVMTATPIPRTLAMTAFGDLDVSVIDELPPGRQPIFTRMAPETTRDDVYAWVAKKLQEGQQAYVVVPAIDEPAEEVEPAPVLRLPAPTMSDDYPTPPPVPPLPPDAPTASGVIEVAAPARIVQNLRSAVATQKELQSGPLAGFRVGLIHGRLARETRQHIMERFRQGLIDVLVATTVIEVGVDVPNAGIMIIEHANRFGLSQLHQLRGRVGRGTKQSYCVLLGEMGTDDAVKRLQAMVKHSSGFKIAEEDLKLRGMGQMIGTAQSGRSELHFADMLFDPHLLPMSRRDAFNLVAADPRLLDATHVELRGAVLARFADTISLADVG